MQKDYFNMIKTAEIDSDAVQKVETNYHCVLPEQLRHIVSFKDEDRFGDEIRLLSLNEIINADDYLGLNFTTRGLMPIFDRSEALEKLYGVSV